VSPSSELLIIINNAAAKARAAWPQVQKQLAAANIAVAFRETKYAGDATNIVREALRSSTKTIAVVGGDGTLSEAAEGFFEFGSNLNDLPARLAFVTVVFDHLFASMLPQWALAGKPRRAWQRREI
jgi:diacylglycerol kinase family enzyme